MNKQEFCSNQSLTCLYILTKYSLPRKLDKSLLTFSAYPIQKGSLLHIKFQGQQSSGSYYGFYHIWACWPSWPCDLYHLYMYFLSPLRLEVAYECNRKRTFPFLPYMLCGRAKYINFLPPFTLRLHMKLN